MSPANRKRLQLMMSLHVCDISVMRKQPAVQQPACPAVPSDDRNPGVLTALQTVQQEKKKKKKRVEMIENGVKGEILFISASRMAAHAKLSKTRV